MQKDKLKKAVNTAFIESYKLDSVANIYKNKYKIEGTVFSIEIDTGINSYRLIL